MLSSELDNVTIQLGFSNNIKLKTANHAIKDLKKQNLTLLKH